MPIQNTMINFLTGSPQRTTHGSFSEKRRYKLGSSLGGRAVGKYIGSGDMDLWLRRRFFFFNFWSFMFFSFFRERGALLDLRPSDPSG